MRLAIHLVVLLLCSTVVLTQGTDTNLWSAVLCANWVSGLRDARGAYCAVPQISVDHQKFCTCMHRNAQSCRANSIDAFEGQDYVVARLSREALKTSQLS
jgi:hypothetical protein